MKWAVLLIGAMAVSGCIGTSGGNNFAANGGMSLVAGPDANIPVKRNSWFASFRSGPVEMEAAKNSGPLPFGAVRKVCGLSNRTLGTQVETQGGFKMFDTNPELLAPRTHYVTGFRDGCARKFTAGLAFLGDPIVHEIQRYRSTRDFSTVDKAYEVLKARVCRVKEGEVCGENTPKLVSNTIFVSMYRNFTDQRSAGAVLLHKGNVHASDFDG